MTHTKNIKHWAKELFKPTEFSPLDKGFMLNRVTVLAKNEVVEITDFDGNGKDTTANFLMPSSRAELIKRMIHHCGEEKINGKLKNSILVI